MIPDFPDIPDFMCKDEGHENPRVYCAACFARLPDASEEWECRDCGAAITQPEHFISRKQWLDANQKIDQDLREWTALNKATS